MAARRDWRCPDMLRSQGLCAAPGRCRVNRWCDCRQARADCARHAVRALALQRLTERGPREAAHRVAEGVARRAIEADSTALSRRFAGTRLPALVENLTHGVLRRRASSELRWDGQLVAASLLGGDAGADLCHLVRKMTHAECASFPPADRDAVYGAVLVRLLDERGRRLLALRDPERLPRYVRVVVRRERGHRRSVSTAMELREPRFLERLSTPGFEKAGVRDLRDALRKILDGPGDSCTPLQERVLRLRFEGRSWMSISDELGGTKSSVRDAYRRGVEGLRRRIREVGDRHPPPQ